MRPRLFISLFLPLLILMYAPARAQSLQSTIDSLHTLLKTAEYDTNRVRLYANLSWHYAGTREKTDSARMYADSTKILSEQLQYPKGINLAYFYYGVIARHEGNYSQALDHLNRFVTFQEKAGDSTRVAHGLFQIGTVYSTIGDYEKSLATYYRVLQIYETNSSYFDIGYTLNTIGVIYKNMKKYEDAIHIYRRALSIYDSLDVKEDQSNVLGNLGNVYADAHQFEEAKRYYQQSLHIDQEMGFKWGIAYNMENIGTMFNRMQQYDSALVYQLHALEIRKELPQKFEIAITHKQLGYTYLFLKDYSLSEYHLMNGVTLAKELKSKPLIRDVYGALAKLFAAKKNFADAYFYHQKYEAMKDSVLDEQTAKQLNELQAKYETAKKNEEIATLSRENELQTAEAEQRAVWNRVLIGGLMLLAVIAGLVIVMLRQQFKNQRLVAAKNEEIKIARFKQQLSELEMKALRAQMNPHFIFNCMNSINRMILSSDSDNASRYLTKFSKLIRLMLENSEHPSVSLKDELVMLEAYIQLEALRFKGKISYRISVDDGVDQENTLVPSMVLQPFIENAIWHGLMHKDGEGLINISISEDNDMLRCIIEDNGVGREKALELQGKMMLKHQSMGLQITEERLQLLNSRELKELIRITDLKDPVNRALGTRVDISIPIA